MVQTPRLQQEGTLSITINPKAAKVRFNTYKTIQKAYRDIAQHVDLRGNKVVLNLVAGNHVSFETKYKLFGGHILEIKGTVSGTNPTKIGSGKGHSIQNSIAGLDINISNVHIAGGLYATQCGTIYVLSGVTFQATENDHLQATYLGQIFVRSGYAINGTAQTSIHAYTGGTITINDHTRIELTAGVGFTARFIGVADASVVARNLWVSQWFTGQVYLVHKLGFADLNKDNSNLHGSVPSTVATGGIVT